jgi:hypothetical protein
MSREILLHLTEAEAAALYGMAAAGQYEWAEVIDRDPDATPQGRAATLKAGERAMRKLQEA